MKYIDRNETFVAVSKAIIKPDYYTEPSEDKLSEELDYILVHPIKSIRLLSNFNSQNIDKENSKLKITKNLAVGTVIVGFVEIITDKQVIKRQFNLNKNAIVDLDMKAKHEIPIIGDVTWEVDDKILAKNILNISELRDYMHLSKEQIYFKLDNMHIRANQIGLENYINEILLEKKQDNMKKRIYNK